MTIHRIFGERGLGDMGAIYLQGVRERCSLLRPAKPQDGIAFPLLMPASAFRRTTFLTVMGTEVPDWIAFLIIGFFLASFLVINLDNLDRT